MIAQTPSSGKLVVISAPSGAGKTTIARAMLAEFPALSFSVSATTRPMREGETDGEDYFFLTRGEFERRIAAGEFAEWEEIYGNLYGSLKSEIDRAGREGRHLLFDVDVKGALSLKGLYPEALLVFIRPPSIEVLTRRLRDRKTEDEETFARRMQRVAMEMGTAGSFDRVFVNDDLQRAIAEVKECIKQYLGA